MKTNQENQTEVLEVKKHIATHALITNVELSNGKKSQVVTLFNFKEVGFEEVNIGLANALSMQQHISSMQSTLNVIKDGQLEESSFFAKRVFTDENRYHTRY